MTTTKAAVLADSLPHQPISPERLAHSLGLNPQTVRRKAHKKEWPSTLIANKIYFTQENIEAIMRQGSRGPEITESVDQGEDLAELLHHAKQLDPLRLQELVTFALELSEGQA